MARWHVVHYAALQRVGPHQFFRWHNRERGPADAPHVVAQRIISGRIQFVDSSTHSAEAGQLLLFTHDEDSSYSLFPGERQALLTNYVVLDGAGLQGLWRELIDRYGPLFPAPDDSPLAAAFANVLSAAQSADNPHNTFAAISTLVLTLYQVAEGKHQAALSPVERAIDQLLHSPVMGYSLKALAEQAGVSREHLTRIFTARHGHSPAQHLAAARLARAQGLLRSSSLSLADIAQQAGYGSTHSLARALRSSSGQSPRAFRKKP